MNQTAFSFSGKNSYDLEEFIESESNSQACRAINYWEDSWGVEPYPRALVIRGGRYSGKTFLAKKWSKATNALFINKNHELTENILSDHLTFIIEDFDSSWDEEGFLHLFNLLAENKKYLLITCNSIPEIKLPDLSSRIKSLNLIHVNQPDDDMMKMLIFKLFSNYSVVIGSEVVNFLIKYLPREFPFIVESVDKINKFALENKRKITIPLIKEAVKILV